MLKRAWYVAETTSTDTELPAQRKAAPLLTGLNCALLLLHDLSEAVPHARTTIADAPHLARWLLGLNHVSAYLAQITARLAYQSDTDSGADLGGLTTRDRIELTNNLAAASRRLEESAGLLKLAHAHLVHRPPAHRRNAQAGRRETAAPTNAEAPPTT